jgi:hypothetical protein
MTHQYSVAVRDARNDAIETAIGGTAKLYIFSGAEPGSCAAADPAGLLATLTLPADWMQNSATGVKVKSAAAWSGTASAPGTAASYRIKDNAGTTCHIQGTVTATGGGGDLTLDNTSITAGQTITINTYQITDGNA